MTLTGGHKTWSTRNHCPRAHVHKTEKLVTSSRSKIALQCSTFNRISAASFLLIVLWPVGMVGQTKSAAAQTPSPEPAGMAMSDLMSISLSTGAAFGAWERAPGAKTWNKACEEERTSVQPATSSRTAGRCWCWPPITSRTGR
jgi:hypothetical protein